MKVTLVLVMSIDGRTTCGTEPGSAWASAEDQTHFHALLEQSKVVVMGSTTYRVAKPFMKLSSNTRRIVMTHEPEQYMSDTVPGQLEFTNESPEILVKRLEVEKYEDMLLVSGEKLSTVFLNAGLVGEVWATVEPVIFGAGKGMTGELASAIDLEFISSEKLNEKGTLLLKYKVIAK